MKVVLWTDDGWSPIEIARALFIEESTVKAHLKVYREEDRLTPNHKGSSPILTAQELSDHLESRIYVKIKEIQAYVKSALAIKRNVTNKAWFSI